MFSKVRYDHVNTRIKSVKDGKIFKSYVNAQGDLSKFIFRIAEISFQIIIRVILL